jgi:hypothetical protein
MSVCNVKIRLQGRIGSALAHDTLRECRRLLTELLPEPEVIGLLSLMLLQESRRAARTSPTGDLILLENQDRSLWNREQIAEGVALLEKALKSRRFGSYTLQAAIAAVHAEAESRTTLRTRDRGAMGFLVTITTSRHFEVASSSATVAPPTCPVPPRIIAAKLCFTNRTSA